MGRTFFFYWRDKQISESVTDGLLDHSGSDQFASIKTGDEIWIGGHGKSKSSRLITIGRLRVAEVVGPEEAKRRLGKRAWPKKYTALCAQDDETVAQKVDLDDHIINQLRFVSPHSTFLDLRRPLGRQLQRLRQLTEDSAKLLKTVWEEGVRITEDEVSQVEKSLTDLDKLDEQRQIVVRREQQLLRNYLFREEKFGTCAICEERLPVILLVAAHIKPRKKCSDEERRDPANVVPMCLLGCDALFERGLITVVAGKVRIRLPRALGPASKRFSGLHGQSPSIWKPKRRKYFEWHASLFGNNS